MGEHAVNHVKTVTAYPGVPLVKDKAVTKLGMLQQEPVSLPKRIANFVREKVQHLRGHDAPKVKVGMPVLPAMPKHANVGFQVLKSLGNALAKLDTARLQTGATVDGHDDSLEVHSAQRLMLGFLEQIGTGAALPAMTPAMHKALEEKDRAGFAAALKQATLDQTPPALHEAVGRQFDSMVVPALGAHFSEHGMPEPAKAPAVQLQPKTHTAVHVLPPAHLQDLPSSGAHFDRVVQGFAKVAAAMELGDSREIERELSALMVDLSTSLKGTSPTTKLAFALSDGKAFMQDLSHAIVHAAPDDAKQLVKQELEHWMGPYLHDAFRQLVDGALDKVVAKDRHGPKTLAVMGHKYVRVGDTPIGQGIGGKVWQFANPKNLHDQVAVKQPLPGDGDRHQALVEGPLQELRNAVQAQGTGGGNKHGATMIGVASTKDEVYGVYRLETGGSMFGALKKINDNITPDLAQAKLGLMSAMAAAVMHAHSQGVYHNDTALRNFVMGSDKLPKMLDFGLARMGPENGPIEGGSLQVDGTGLVPVKWTAPETLLGKVLTDKSPVYGLGAALLEMVIGKTEDRGGPFPLHTNKQVFEMHKDGKWNPEAMVPALDKDVWKKWPGVDVGALRSLIVRMLDGDPARRPSLVEVQNFPLFGKVTDAHMAAMQALLQGTSPGPASSSRDGYDLSPASSDAYSLISNYSLLPTEGDADPPLTDDNSAQMSGPYARMAKALTDPAPGAEQFKPSDNYNNLA